MTKFERDTILDAVILLYNTAKDDQEFREALERFRNDKVVFNPNHNLKEVKS